MEPARSSAAVITAPMPVTRRIQRDVAVHNGEAVHRVVLSNGGMSVSLLTYGGVIEHIAVPDRHGMLSDVVMGFDSVEEYFVDRCYFGAVVGRYANRIGRAQFPLDGNTYHLEANDGDNHLHGGTQGFHARVWTLALPRSVDGGDACLTIQSPDGEGGYPGSVSVSVTYTLTPTNALIVDYEATTDRATPFSPTQHTYFNLTGTSGSVLGHHLLINASHFTPVTSTLIPTGELRPVDGTDFDFRASQPIGARIDSADRQMVLGGGYDHNYVLDPCENATPQCAARLLDPVSGRRLEVLTTAPGIQLCTGNSLHRGVRGRRGVIYGRHAGVALETQHFPDAPNQPAFPSAILRPGDRFQSRTVFQFSASAGVSDTDTPSHSP